MKLSNFLSGSSIFALIGGLLALAAAIVAAKREALPLVVVVILVIGSIFSIGAAFWSAAEQATFQNYVTGGNNYVYLKFEDQGDDYYRLNIKLGGQDDSPVHDVLIEVTDVLAYVGLPDPRELRQRQSTEYTMSFNIVTSHMKRSIQPAKRLEGNRARFHVVVTAANRSIEELIQLEKVDGKWRSAIRVYSDAIHLKPMLEEIDPEYPRLPNDEVDWVRILKP